LKVRWTKAALGHLTAIYEYISLDSSLYAIRVVDKLTIKSRLLGDFPHSGSLVPEYQDQDIRQVVEWPYRIFYRITENEVQVLAILHGARQISGDTPPDH